MSERFAELDAALDSESWDWLNDNCPPLAISVQRAVDKDVSAEEIKRRVIDRLGAHRLPLAQRCEAASRHLHTLKQKT